VWLCILALNLIEFIVLWALDAPIPAVDSAPYLAGSGAVLGCALLLAYRQKHRPERPGPVEPGA